MKDVLGSWLSLAVLIMIGLTTSHCAIKSTCNSYMSDERNGDSLLGIAK